MAEPLLDIAIAKVLKCARQQLSRETLSRIVSMFRTVIAGSPSSDLSRVLQTTIDTTEPLDRIMEILSVPDQPLPEPINSSKIFATRKTRRKPRAWSHSEDIRLLAAIHRFGLESWAPIATFVGASRTRAQCSQRWARGLNPRLLKTEWSYQEEEQLIGLVGQYGTKKWKRIATAMGSRSDVQCRYHFFQMVRAGVIEQDREVWKRMMLSPWMARQDGGKHALLENINLQSKSSKTIESDTAARLQSEEGEIPWVCESNVPDDDRFPWIGTEPSQQDTVFRGVGFD